MHLNTDKTDRRTDAQTVRWSAALRRMQMFTSSEAFLI